MDGRALPASTLSSEARVGASTTSVHLNKLVQGGLITVEKQGCYHYYRLKDNRVAQALEALALISPLDPIRSLSQGTKANALRSARSCYDHLAGQLGISIMQSFLDAKVLLRSDSIKVPSHQSTDFLSARVKDHPYYVGPEAEKVLASLGIDLSDISIQKRALLAFCLDWSEQKHHLVGVLGALLMERFLELGWIYRGKFPRSILISGIGKESFKYYLGIEDV